MAVRASWETILSKGTPGTASCQRTAKAFGTKFPFHANDVEAGSMKNSDGIGVAVFVFVAVGSSQRR